MDHYFREVRAYWRDTRTLRDFVRLIRIRLSLSKLGWLACPRPLIVAVDLESFGGPVWLRSHTSDISVLKEQLVSDGYGAIVRRTHAPETIVDLGANTGLVARWLMQRYPAARLICVEPEPENVEMLARNLAGAATIVAACIGGRERRVALGTSTGSWGVRMVDGDGQIPVVTMPWLIAEHELEHIDILKCDIEGAEEELFADAPWMERVGMAVVECHGLPGEAILPDGWRITERDGNPVFPGYETVTLVPGAAATAEVAS
jgi:FkbM family methyltransferase